MKLLERPKKANICSESGRLAVYDSKVAPPRLVSIEAESRSSLIEKLSETTYKECQQKGASFPYVVLKEIIENLVHAGFKETVVSVLNNGNTIRVSDQGPGIKDKVAAFEPGYTTATSEMKKFIRGVGSGLPVVKEIMAFSGGSVEIKDNLKNGTVVTLCLSNKEVERKPVIRLTKRQASILSLVTELEFAGPSDISKELGLSLSTVHRELVCLEDKGLLKSNGQGKRYSTSKGLHSLNITISASEDF